MITLVSVSEISATPRDGVPMNWQAVPKSPGSALYQIESGKTGLPRASTLRRIAVALDVSMDDLLGNAEPAGQVKGHSSVAAAGSLDWIPGEGGPLTLPGGTSTQTGFNHLGTPDDSRNDERLGNEQARGVTPLASTPCSWRG